MGVFSERAEMFVVPKVESGLSALADALFESYSDVGLSTTSLERYRRVAPEPDRKNGDDYDDDDDDAPVVHRANHKEFSETEIWRNNNNNNNNNKL